MKIFSNDNRNFLSVRASTGGFTLVEAIIVVAILGILAAIAVPLYQNYITSSKRSTANAVLEQFPILLETFRAENGTLPPAGAYAYTEAANGAVTSNTIRTAVGAGGAGLTDFTPRPTTQPANQGIPFDYTLNINAAGVATFTATGVRENNGVNANGTYQ